MGSFVRLNLLHRRPSIQRDWLQLMAQEGRSPRKGELGKLWESLSRRELGAFQRLEQKVQQGSEAAALLQVVYLMLNAEYVRASRCLPLLRRRLPQLRCLRALHKINQEALHLRRLSAGKDQNGISSRTS